MESERILLRPWLESDAETLFKYASDPDVGPRAGWAPHQSVEESCNIIKTVFNKEPTTWAISIKDNKVTLIVNAVEAKEDINIERAKAAKARAEERLTSKDINIDVKRAELALRRALTRINTFEEK